MESYETQFVYVDGYYQKKGSEKGTPWKRYKLTDLHILKKKAENYNVFATIQQFASPNKSKDYDSELIYGPLYFDLDTQDKLLLDFVKEDARKIIDFFVKGLCIHQSHVRLFFSGKKGFHIIVHPSTLDISPELKLNHIFKLIALYLESYLELKTLDSASIYSKPRQLRLLDSIHQSTGLFKIELYHDDLNKSADEITKLAKEPRGQLWQDEDLRDVAIVEPASIFYKHFVDVFKGQERIEKLKPINLIQKSGEMAVCVKDLLENHIKKSGSRNLATMVLACYFKDQGFSEIEIEALLIPWAQRTPKNFTSTHDERKLKASTIGCIRAILSNENYHFICSVMRSLSDEIKCEFEQCAIANEEDQKPEREIIVHLAEASDAIYRGKKLKTKVLVTGKDTLPYIIPKRIQLLCKPELDKEGNKCNNCKLIKHGGRFEVVLTERHPILLQCIQCSETQKNQALKQMFGEKNCAKITVSTLEEGNLEELELTPELDSQISYTEGNDDFVTRKAYYIGHGMPINQELEISCYTYPAPKTQQAIHLFSDYSSAETSLNSFKFDERKAKELSIFKKKQNQSVKEKFFEIHKDFEFNVHHIWQRTPLFIAIDLVYHSVLNFYFQKEFLKRGWTELFVLGDSGQGKSVGIERICRHYNFGYRINGEGARRTGLAFTWHKIGERWSVSFGTIPRNDRRLVIIDEASGIDPEELSKLTDMRSEGVADAINGPMPAKTHARTRIIWMSNTKSGHPLSEYPYPVKAITEIFKRSEDIRRFDLAIAVKSGDVGNDVIHQLISDKEKVEHVYISTACKNLILWAWTRKADQIHITEEAEKEILEASKLMSQKYSSLIPLVEPADQRNKIARLSVATAVRLFSTEEDFNIVHVNKEHVEFVKWFLESQYDSHSLDYFNFSKTQKTALMETEYDNAYKMMLTISDNQMLAETLVKTPIFGKNILEEILGYDREDVKNILKMFYAHNLIKTVAKGFRLSAAGVSFFKRFAEGASITENKKVEFNKVKDNKETEITFNINKKIENLIDIDDDLKEG